MPLALSALGGRLGARHLLLLAVVHAWLLYLGSSLAFGAIAFNEAFPLDVALIPVSAIGLARALRRLGTPAPPGGYPNSCSPAAS